MQEWIRQVSASEGYYGRSEVLIPGPMGVDHAQLKVPNSESPRPSDMTIKPILYMQET